MESEGVNVEWRAVLDALGHAGCCVALVSGDGRVIAASPAYAHLLGYSEEQLERLTVRAVTHPDDVDLSRRGYEAVLNGREVSSHVEKRYVGSDGRIIWARVTIALAHEVASESLTVVVCQDLTHRRETETRLRSAIALLQGAPPAATLPIEQTVPRLVGLSRRENEIVGLLLQNRRVSSIAYALGLSRNTVRNHLSSVFRKFGVHSQAQLLDRVLHESRLPSS